MSYTSLEHTHTLSLSLSYLSFPFPSLIHTSFDLFFVPFVISYMYEPEGVMFCFAFLSFLSKLRFVMTE